MRVVASRTDAANHAYAHIDAGHDDYTGRPDGTAFPFDARLFCRAHAAIDGWIELAHEVVRLVEAPHAVIFARADERHVWSLLYGNRSHRPPEWGTSLSRAHVDRLGRDALVAAAAAARDVGDLLYLQASERADEALGSEATRRVEALRAVVGRISA